MAADTARWFSAFLRHLTEGRDVEAIPERLAELGELTPAQQTRVVMEAFTDIGTPKDFKAILNALIESGKIDFSTVLATAPESISNPCKYTSVAVEVILNDERIQATVSPDILLSCSKQVYESYQRFRIARPLDVELVNIGDRLESTVQVGWGLSPEIVVVVEASPCRWEVTESALTKFYNKFTNLVELDPDFKELIQHIFPSEAAGAAVAELSRKNRFNRKPALLELLRSLGRDIDMSARRAKLIEISNASEFDSRILELVYDAYNVVKQTQVIKVEFIEFPDQFAYYVLHDCSKRTLHDIAEDYSNALSPVIRRDGTLKSQLPEIYSLEQATEINSWITHGLLSLYLIHPDFVKAVCTNPFVGNEEFWGYVQGYMSRQYEALHSATEPLEQEIKVYRGSTHFKPHAIRFHSIFATSWQPGIANRFSKAEGLGAKITIPAGTHVLDLSKINRDEQEVLIFPVRTGANMIIEPVEKAIGPRNRNTYRIRNVNEARNRNTPRSRRIRQRRYTKKRR